MNTILSEFEITIYTDGSYMSKINRGGWGICIDYHNSYKELDYNGYGGDGGPDTTNQRMELVAVVEAYIYYNLLIKELHRENIPISCNICTDSAYIYNCYKEEWYKKWQKNGWLNSKGDPVANRDLWEIVIEIFEREDIAFMKVKGHSGVKGNEYADLLATTAAKEKRLVNLEELLNENYSD